MSTTPVHLYMSARTLKEIGEWASNRKSVDHSDGITLIVDPYDGTIVAIDPYIERCRKFDAWPMRTPPPPNTKVGGKV